MHIQPQTTTTQPATLEGGNAIDIYIVKAIIVIFCVAVVSCLLFASEKRPGKFRMLCVYGGGALLCIALMSVIATADYTL